MSDPSTTIERAMDVLVDLDGGDMLYVGFVLGQAYTESRHQRDVIHRAMEALADPTRSAAESIMAAVKILGETS